MFYCVLSLWCRRTHRIWNECTIRTSNPLPSAGDWRGCRSEPRAPRHFFCPRGSLTAAVAVSSLPLHRPRPSPRPSAARLIAPTPGTTALGTLPPSAVEKHPHFDIGRRTCKHQFEIVVRNRTYLKRNMNTLKGFFDSQKPPRRNFILENMKHIRTMRKVSDSVTSEESVPRKVNNYPHVTAKVSTHLNGHFRTKGGSATEVSGQCKNSYVFNRSSANSDLSSNRNRPQQFSKTQHKPSKSTKSQGISISISTLENGDVYGKSNSKIFGMMSSIPAVPLTRSASFDEPSHHVTQGDRLCSSATENTVLSEPVRSLGCQTLPPGDVDRILNEGVIKYPSTMKIGGNSSEWNIQRKSRRPTTCDSALQTEIGDDKKEMSIPKSVVPVRMLQTNDEVSNCKRLLNVFHMNNENLFNEDHLHEKLKGVAVRKTSSRGQLRRMLREKQQHDSGEPQSSYHSFEDEESGDTQSCPEDHIFLPEIERVETLKILRKSYEEHIKELNSLPVKTDTLKMRQRKIDLEKQLNKLEEGIKIFSRPKVFVKVGNVI